MGKTTAREIIQRNQRMMITWWWSHDSCDQLCAIDTSE